MAKFKFTPLASDSDFFSARLGSASGSANYLNDNDRGKFVKLVGDSQYGLCAAGDPIEGQISSVESAPLDAFSFGAVQEDGRIAVTLDGLEATPGVGVIAIGDMVVCGTVVAKGTALYPALPKVCKATNQPGTAVVCADNLVATVNAALAEVADAQNNAKFMWRLVSASGTAVGSTGVIELVGD